MNKVKQSSANNAFLKKVKAQWNKKIYARVLSLVNEQDEQAAREYLQHFTTRKIDY